MRRTSPRPGLTLALGLVLALLVGGSFVGLAGTAHASPAIPQPSPPLTGAISGPSVLAYNAAEFYEINGTGGPAINSTIQVGNITYYASLTGNNLTGVSLSPTEGGLVNDTPEYTTLTVSNVSETVTIHLMISSTFGSQNESINLTYSVLITAPYTLTVSVIAGSTTVLPFQIAIYLDGNFAGWYTLPTLTPGQVYTITWAYATSPLGGGWHTFTMQIPTADQGLVTFPKGQYTYSYSFYISQPAPNYTLWIVLGVVAFIAVVFISLILVGGRRRNRAR